MSSILEALKHDETVKAPKCIFVPDQNLLRQMIKAVLKYEKDPLEVLLLRFGLHRK